MKKIILLFLSFGVVSCGQVKQQVSEQARVNVMSYNIRYDNPEDGMNTGNTEKTVLQRLSDSMMLIYWVHRKCFTIS